MKLVVVFLCAIAFSVRWLVAAHCNACLLKPRIKRALKNREGIFPPSKDLPLHGPL